MQRESLHILSRCFCLLEEDSSSGRCLSSLSCTSPANSISISLCVSVRVSACACLHACTWAISGYHLPWAHLYWNVFLSLKPCCQSSVIHNYLIILACHRGGKINRTSPSWLKGWKPTFKGVLVTLAGRFQNVINITVLRWDVVDWKFRRSLVS